MPYWLAIPLLLLTTINAAHAADDENLRDVRSRLSEAKQSSASLLKEQTQLKEELRQVQQTLVETTTDLRRVEESRTALQSALARTRANIIAAELRLLARESEQQSMLQSMLRLSSVPKEAWLVMPISLSDMVRGSHALHWIQNRLHHERVSLKDELAQLDHLRVQQQTLQLSLAKEQQVHESTLQQMQSALEERRSKLDTIGTAYRKKMREAAYLASREASMTSLIETISKSRRARLGAVFNKPTPPGKQNAPTINNDTIFEGKRGTLTRPVSGNIIENFGAPMGEGKREGFLLEATSNHVVAPDDGEIVYSGSFLEYDHMIIIRHSEHYHSLIAGMAHNLVQPGQFVLKGEPIALMQHAGERLTNLYVELRKNAKPVDPSQWFVSG